MSSASPTDDDIAFERETREAWTRVRALLAARGRPVAGHLDSVGPCAACCPDCSECWQYMGDGEFRHRCSRAAHRGTPDAPARCGVGAYVYLRVDDCEAEAEPSGSIPVPPQR